MQHGTPREFTKESDRHSAAKDGEIADKRDEIMQLVQTHDMMTAELAALREDKERLDWLEQPTNQLNLFGYFVKGGSETALRSMIDYARA